MSTRSESTPTAGPGWLKRAGASLVAFSFLVVGLSAGEVANASTTEGASELAVSEDTQQEEVLQETAVADQPAATLKTAKVTVSGKKAVGKTLKAKRGTWTKGTKFTYQWLRNGKKISGATKASYTLKVQDAGKRISVRVTGKKTGYETASKTSAETTKIPKLTLKKGKVSISGTKRAGKTLKAKRGTWTKGTKFTYQWLRNGKKISGATKASYTLKVQDAGKRISVRVTGKKTGYKTASKTSAKTTKIAKIKLTREQRAAVAKGRDYLRYAPGFSRTGLIDQLVYEKFSKRNATIAVDYISPSWNKQAAIAAKDYVKYVGGFSKRGLIDQLRFDGFTNKQAEYGARAAGY